MELALRGSGDATREYVRRYRELTIWLLVNAQHIDPHLVVVTDDERSHSSRQTATWRRAPIEAIENAAAEAPFTPCGARYELVDATGWTSRAACGYPWAPSVVHPPSTTAWAPAGDDLEAQRFIRRVCRFLNHPEAPHPLQRVADAFALSKTELAGLFGVRRRAVDQWLARG